MKSQLVCLGVFIGAAAGLGQSLAEEATPLLPLGRSWVGDQKNLPLPYGVGADYYYQRQGYDITRLGVTVPNLPPALAGALQNPNLASAIQVKTRVNEGDGKLDAWLLPFLNVFVLGGYVTERTTVTGIPAPINQLQVNEEGYIFGGGMTLAGNIDRLWGSLMIAETYADLSGNDSWIRAWVVTPKVGVQLDAPWGDRALNVWVGGMFQRADEDHSGTENTAVGPVIYNVKLQEQEAWNFLFGASVTLCQNWQASVEAGVGQREQLTTSLIYRF